MPRFVDDIFLSHNTKGMPWPAAGLKSLGMRVCFFKWVIKLGETIAVKTDREGVRLFLRGTSASAFSLASDILDSHHRTCVIIGFRRLRKPHLVIRWGAIFKGKSFGLRRNAEGR